jgi:hypothetical protein
MTFESPVVDTPKHKAASDRDRWMRWFETAVTAATGLAAIVLVSFAAAALRLI